ncbi:hypothetical protein ACU8WE_06935 [Pseudomonas parakoreensis]
MGMFRGVVAVGVLVSMSGCGAYNDFKANNAVQEYRQACLGNYTNECESKLVDTNIVMLELARSNIDREKDSIVQVVGKDGFERFSKTANELIDHLVDQQENKRPGFFCAMVPGGSPTVRKYPQPTLRHFRHARTACRSASKGQCRH